MTNQNQLFRNILSEISSGCQAVSTQIRPNMAGMVWVQTVCKDYQPTTL